MRKTRITEAQILEELKRKVDRKFGLTQEARRLGITPQYLHNVVNGKRPLSDRVAQAMGYRRVVEFERAA
jgi:plasmid maintenance system antidote protein VapI